MSDPGARARPWRALGLLFGLLATVWLAGTGAFAFDSGDTRFVARRGGFGLHHSCVTAYAIATHLAVSGADNLYDPRWYRGDGRVAEEVVHGGFTVDRFHYSPGFLVLPYLLLAVGGDFVGLRWAWFVVTVLVLVGSVAGIATWCGAYRARPRLLLYPLLFCAPTVHLALQIGNAHLLVLALSMLGMLAFATGHRFAGGACLGFAIVTKLWPAVLVGYLLLQRRWRAAAWAGAAVLTYTSIGLALFGTGPVCSFATYELPRYTGGEAFAIFETEPLRIANMSALDVPHKLADLAAPGSALGPAMPWLCMAIVAAVVLAAGLQRIPPMPAGDDRLRQAGVWLALLTLAQVCSPFLPWVYGVVSTLWLVLLLLGLARRRWQMIALAGMFVVLAPNVPVGMTHAVAFHLVYTLVALLLMCGLSLVTALQFRQHSRASALR